MPSDEIAADIGATLRHLRIERNMRQDELAAKVGVHANSIRGYEHARFRLTFDKLVRIAEALDMEPADVVRAYQEVAAGRLTATRRRRTVG